MKRFVFFLALAACTSSADLYYGLEVPKDVRGTLLGATEEDDVPLTECYARPGKKSPCVVMFSSEFFKLRRDYLEMKERLKACER